MCSLNRQMEPRKLRITLMTLLSLKTVERHTLMLIQYVYRLACVYGFMNSMYANKQKRTVINDYLFLFSMVLLPIFYRTLYLSVVSNSVH